MPSLAYIPVESVVISNDRQLIRFGGEAVGLPSPTTDQNIIAALIQITLCIEADAVSEFMRTAEYRIHECLKLFKRSIVTCFQ